MLTVSPIQIGYNASNHTHTIEAFIILGAFQFGIFYKKAWTKRPNLLIFPWSGKRDSNSRPSPWQGDALPLSYFRIYHFGMFKSIHFN
jgi:hypothetical protein